MYVSGMSMCMCVAFFCHISWGILTLADLCYYISRKKRKNQFFSRLKHEHTVSLYSLSLFASSNVNVRIRVQCKLIIIWFYYSFKFIKSFILLSIKIHIMNLSIFGTNLAKITIIMNSQIPNKLQILCIVLKHYWLKRINV